MTAPSFKDRWRDARELFARASPQLLSLLWERRARLAVGLALLIVARLAALALPASSKLVVDEVILAGRTELLVWIVSAVAGATLVQAGVGYALEQLVGQTGLRTVADARKRLMTHVLRLPVSFFDHDRSGQLASRIYYDAEGLSNLVGAGLLRFSGGVLTAVLAAAVLLYIDWVLATVVIGLLLVLSIPLILGSLRLGPLYGERAEIIVRTHGRLTEMLGGVRIVKAYTAEKREDRIFTRGTHEVLRRSRRILGLSSLLTAMSSVALGAVAVVVLFLGVRRVLEGTMSLGDLVMFVAFLALVVAPLGDAVGMASELAQALASLDRMSHLGERETESAGDGARERVSSLIGDVRFENVAYSYLPERPVLRDLSFTAEAGTTTALVGPSGSGKSTIFRLILGFDHPAGGRVLVDGRDLRRLRQSDYRRFLGVVLQEDFLFDGTVLENILYARPRSSRADAVRAGELAHCEEFVAELPDGWDTVVGERGVRLSGGQRQRVTIARAILADPRILLLDEATSSLDSRSELHIRAALQALCRGRTTLVIAHRLSTVRGADQILVLDGGRLLERGRHDELLRSGGRYRELWEMQIGGDVTAGAASLGGTGS